MITRRSLLAGAACSLCSGMAHAQTIPARLDLENSTLCGVHPEPRFRGVTEVRAPSPDALRSLQWLTHTMGIEGNFILLEGDFTHQGTAFAAARGPDDVRYIVYNHAKFDWTPEDPNWTEVTILGHELGHHLNGDTRRPYPHSREAWARELRADQTAGFLVSRLGGTLEAAQAFFHGTSESGSETHPPRDLRLDAIATGWQRAEALKRWEEPSCQTEWLSGDISVGQDTCRIVRPCEWDDSPRLACQDLLGDWVVR